jgi:hypothetical protein
MLQQVWSTGGTWSNTTGRGGNLLHPLSMEVQQVMLVELLLQYNHQHHKTPSGPQPHPTRARLAPAAPQGMSVVLQPLPTVPRVWAPGPLIARTLQPPLLIPVPMASLGFHRAIPSPWLTARVDVTQPPPAATGAVLMVTNFPLSQSVHYLPPMRSTLATGGLSVHQPAGSAAMRRVHWAPYQDSCQPLLALIAYQRSVPTLLVTG